MSIDTSPIAAETPRVDVLSLFPSNRMRSEVLAELTPLVVGYDLHWWRWEIEGDAAEEAALLNVLRDAKIGTPIGATVAVELNARLESLPSPPLHLEADALSAELEVIRGRWAASPNDVELARQTLRLKARLSSLSPHGTTTPYAEPHRNGRPGRDEVLQLLIADARRLATEPVEAEDAVAMALRLQVGASRLEKAPDQDAWKALVAAAKAGKWEVFWPAFFAARRKVVAKLLRETLGSQPEELRLATDREVEETRPKEEAAPRPSRSRRILVRVATMVVGAAGVFALMLAPSVLSDVPNTPGTMPADRLTQRTTPRCATCPSGDRVEAMGAVRTDGHLYVNIDLASEPSSARLTIELAGEEAPLEIEQAGSGNDWGIVPGPLARRGAIAVEAKGKRVVISLGDASDASDFAIATGGGDRMPAAGFEPVKGPEQAGFNWVDVVLILLLGFAAWRGSRKGIRSLAPSLAALVVGLLLVRLLMPPVGSLIQGWLVDVPRVANAIAIAILSFIGGFLLFMAGRKAVDRWVKPLTERLPEGGLGAGMGAGVGVLRSTMSIAILLLLVVDLATVSLLGRSVSTSLIGGSITSITRGAFGG